MTGVGDPWPLASRAIARSHVRGPLEEGFKRSDGRRRGLSRCHSSDMTAGGLGALILTLIRLVRTSVLLLDVGEGVAEAGWRRVFGGEGVAACAVWTAR